MFLFGNKIQKNLKATACRLQSCANTKGDPKWKHDPQMINPPVLVAQQTKTKDLYSNLLVWVVDTTCLCTWILCTTGRDCTSWMGQLCGLEITDLLWLNPYVCLCVCFRFVSPGQPGNRQEFSTLARKRIMEVLNSAHVRQRLNRSEDSEDEGMSEGEEDTWVFPLVQMKPLGIQVDEQVTQVRLRTWPLFIGWMLLIMFAEVDLFMVPLITSNNHITWWSLWTCD